MTSNFYDTKKDIKEGQSGSSGQCSTSGTTAGLPTHPRRGHRLPATSRTWQLILLLSSKIPSSLLGQQYQSGNGHGGFRRLHLGTSRPWAGRGDRPGPGRLVVGYSSVLKTFSTIPLALFRVRKGNKFVSEGHPRLPAIPMDRDCTPHSSSAYWPPSTT